MATVSGFQAGKAGLAKPTFSPEQMCEIGELSGNYLKPDALELSDEDMLPSLCALHALSIQKEGKMSKEHAERVQKIALDVISSAFAKHGKK